MDLMFRVDPSVSSYRLLIARTINDAYDWQGTSLNGVVGVNVPFTYPVDFPRGAMYRSDFLVQRGLGWIGESTRGQTRILLDLSEFYGTNPSVPADYELTFMRVQEFNVATGAFGAPGPIHIITPANFSNIPGGLTLAGTAPNTGIVAGTPPSDSAMWLSLPRYCATSNIVNRDNTNELLMAWEYAQTTGGIEANQSLGLNGVQFKNLLLEAVGGTAQWSGAFSIVGSS
jgi:hypothetical protein